MTITKRFIDGLVLLEFNGPLPLISRIIFEEENIEKRINNMLETMVREKRLFTIINTASSLINITKTADEIIRTNNEQL